MIKIAPSILSADFAHMGDDIERLNTWNADWIHFDVMDGHYVKNITFGASMCAAVRPLTNLPLDVHLMVTRPGDWIEDFYKAGADGVTIHLEAEGDKQELLQKIASLNMRPGIVINPETPVEALLPYLPYCGLVLLMTVNPGFGGQAFKPEIMDKVRFIRKELTRMNSTAEIEVDGGVNLTTAPLCIDAGASVLVAGSAVFKSEDPKATVAALRCGH